MRCFLFSLFIFPYMTHLFSQNSSYGGEKFRFSVEFREKYDYMRIVEGMPGIGKRKPVIAESRYFSYSLGVRLHKPQPSQISVTIEHRTKYDRFEEVLNDQSMSLEGYASDPYKYYAFGLHYRHYKGLQAGIGYRQERFEISWRYWEGLNQFGVTDYIEFAKIIPLSISYEQKLFSLFRMPFSITPSVGYSFAFGNGGKAYREGDGGVGVSILYPYSDTLIFMDRSYRHKEFDINRKFSFFETRLQLEIGLSKYFSAFCGYGYNFGTKIIGRTNVDFSINRGPTRYIATESRGNNKYFTLGLKIRAPKYIKSQKDHK